MSWYIWRGCTGGGMVLPCPRELTFPLPVELVSTLPTPAPNPPAPAFSVSCSFARPALEKSMMSWSMRLLRRLRTAQVASAMIKTRPTRVAAVMTPTERALFWRNDLGEASACDVAAADAVSLDVTVTVDGRVDVGDKVALAGGVDVAVSLEVGVKGVVEEAELVVVSDAVVELEVDVLSARSTTRTGGKGKK